jgi:hypothetical protein
MKAIKLGYLAISLTVLAASCGSVTSVSPDAQLDGNGDHPLGAGGSAGGTAGTAGKGGSSGSTGVAGSAGSGGSAESGGGGAAGGKAGGAGITGAAGSPMDGGADGSGKPDANTDGGSGSCATDNDCVFRSQAGCCGVCLAKNDPVPPPLPSGVACRLGPPSCVCENHRCTVGSLPAGAPCDPGHNLCGFDMCCRLCGGAPPPEGGVNCGPPLCTQPVLTGGSLMCPQAA